MRESLVPKCEQEVNFLLPKKKKRNGEFLSEQNIFRSQVNSRLLNGNRCRKNCALGCESGCYCVHVSPTTTTTGVFRLARYFLETFKTFGAVSLLITSLPLKRRDVVLEQTVFHNP